MIYSIYNKSTGKIEKTVSCPENLIDKQFNSSTQNVVDGLFADDKYYVAAGVPVEMPPKPSEFHIFDYTTKQWIDPRTPETEWPLVRAKRDRLLQASDWAALPDVPLTTEKRAEWAVYRQALRDVTLQEDPFNITWPIQPS